MKTLSFRGAAGALAALAVGAIATGLPTTEAHAQGGVNAGSLQCNVEGGWGVILGSSKDIRCTYSPAGGGPTQRYSGVITKVGVDIGYTKGGAIIWAVFAPTNEVAPGGLAGSYAGATGQATVGGGVGANVLIGGGNSISLQPLSVSGQQGLNVAGGIGSVRLTFVR